MARRYQIFVSSTYKDLIPQRAQVIKAILNMGHIPVGMEMFSADDAEQWSVIKREIDQSDYYIVIVAHRYGSTIKSENYIGFTEKEYDYAGVAGVPRIGFVVADGVKVDPADMEDKPAGKRKLEAFKKKVMGRPVDFWSSPEDLGMKVVLSLSKLIANNERPGWQRATENGDMALATLARVTDENAQLREENARLLALSGHKVPELDAHFVPTPDDDPNPRQRTYVLRPALTLARHAMSHLSVLNQMLDRLCRMNASTETAAAISAAARALRPSMSAYGRPYRFQAQRLDNVLALLRTAGATVPDSAGSITFDDLTRPMVTPSMLSAPGTYSPPPEPDGGADIQKYKTYHTLEQLINRLNNDVKQRQYVRTHVGLRIAVVNRGRVAAEDLTVRIEVPDEIRLGNFAFDPKQQQEVEQGTQIIEKITLLPAQDHTQLEEFVVQFPLASDSIAFTVRVTGRNLPEPQLIPMTLNISELGGSTAS